MSDDEMLIAAAVAVGAFFLSNPVALAGLGALIGTPLAVGQLRRDVEALGDPQETVSWWSPGLKFLEFIGDPIYQWSQQEAYQRRIF